MEFDIFYEELKKQILEIASEELQGDIDFRMVYKNGQPKQGIIFSPEGSNVGITTYAEDFYRMYEEGISLPYIIENYTGTIHEAEDKIQFAKNIPVFEAKKKISFPLLSLGKVCKMDLCLHISRLKIWRSYSDGTFPVQH